MAYSNAANLLLITFDQLRGDWCDPTNPVVCLPALSRLGKDGWVVRRCYTSSPHCVPARLSWLTGLAPSQLGVTRNANVCLPPDAPSIVRSLRDAGWHTALIGKTHWTSHAQAGDLRDNLPLLQALGFNEAIELCGPRALRRMNCALTDIWQEEGLLQLYRDDLQSRYGPGLTSDAWAVRPTVLPTELYPDVWIADRARELISSMPIDRPWLLWVSFVGPHEPFDTPLPWHGLHASVPLPDPTPEPPWIRRLSEDCELRKAAEIWSGLLTAKAIMACRADYADHLRLLDDQLSKLLDVLDCRVDSGRTAVAVCADHGEALGDARLLYKGSFLEGAIRVPWIYRPAGFSCKPSSSLPIHNHPLPLTQLLQRTFAGLRNGGKVGALMEWADQQRNVFVEFGSERLLIKGNRKLVFDANGATLWAVHLGDDPEEQRNVVTDSPRAWKLSPIWNYMRLQVKKELAYRSSSRWLWRNLGP